MSALVIGIVIWFVLLALLMGFVAGAGETSTKQRRP